MCTYMCLYICKNAILKHNLAKKHNTRKQKNAEVNIMIYKSSALNTSALKTICASYKQFHFHS